MESASLDVAGQTWKERRWKQQWVTGLWSQPPCSAVQCETARSSRQAGGGPPYLVRWSDDGRETLFFPGPDAHISHHESLTKPPAAKTTTAGEVSAAASPPQVKNWRVDLYLLSRMQQLQLMLFSTPAPRQSWTAAERRIATGGT